MAPPTLPVESWQRSDALVRLIVQEFHEAFMRQGYPPIKIVRRALLGNDSLVL